MTGPYTLSAPSREPIAIVGMGARFPGARNVREFWQLLAEGRETIGDYPGGRFPYIDQVYAAGSPFADRIATSRGGFLPGVDRFDAEFFGISPREAALLDPQQRLLLEVAWEAIDDAGLTREALAGTRTGVFVGVWTSDYEDGMYEYSPDVDFHATTGGGRYGASGRIAYALDVRGPNLTIDTACSSSLVAIHLACQSLLTGECSIALAGGVNTILRPEITLVYSQAGMLAPDGRCKFGDAAADGYVRSEGAGVIVLKRLSRAIADGDPIYAVIRGSAVNNDGQSSGLLVSPSRVGQEDVIRTALASAGMSSDVVDYVEAHGTGTLAGDPVEIETIGRVMATPSRSHPCAIGSVKTNIGHTESAAGVAGVMKVALAMDQGLLPASLHFKTPSPGIAWDGLPVIVPTMAAPWAATGRAPVAGVSGFGITGTNAHAVLEGVPPVPSIVRPYHNKARPFVFFLSGQSEGALSDAATSWRDRLAMDPAWPASLADLAYTAGRRRTQHERRLVIAASTRSELDERLAAWLSGEEQPGVVAGARLSPAPRQAVFVYPGQGGQWIGMGRTLYDREPVFHDALDACDAAIRAHTGWSVVDVLRAGKDASRLDEIDVVQPTLFAVMVALTALWRSIGVEPAAVVGHSMGEAAAAAVSGALSLDDAAAVICHRSRLMKRLRGTGRMAVVELSLNETRDAIAKTPNVWIGASNGATSTVISGDADAIDALLVTFEARDIFSRRIQVDVASHSGHMDAIRGELETALAGIRPRQSAIPMYSTTTGQIEDGTALDATYWGKNLCQPVLFHGAVEALLADEYDAFVEVNAHPVLTHAIATSVQESGREAVVTGTIRRDSDDQREIFGAVGRLHVAGYPVLLSALIPDGNCLRLPTYPWQRERHWFEPPANAVAPQRHGIATSSSADDEVNPASCLYDLAWTEAPAAPTNTTRRSGEWLVFANDPIGDRLAAALGARGERYTIVRPGVSFRTIDATTVEIDPSSDSDLAQLIGDGTATPRGVIHAWSLRTLEATPPADAILAAQERGTLSAARLVRTIATLDAPAAPALWFVTHGAQSIGDESTSTPWDAALLGFGRVAAIEAPELGCVNVDLSATPSDADLARAAQLFVDGTAEQQVAVRAGVVLTARYHHASGPAAIRTVRGDGSYLITGGLGGIGLQTARWLVEHGARHIVLAGRRTPSEESMRTIAELEAVGAHITTISADITDPEDVARMIEAASTPVPLAGILHMAVVVDHALVREASDASFHSVFGPKMIGAWHLYEAVRGRSLDFFLLFSSMVDVIPQPRSASYAAANAFLDGLARYGSAQGMPIQSIQWEPWAGTGLMNETKTRGAVRMYEAQGIRPMSPTLGFRILDHALTIAAPVLMAASVDWNLFATVCSANPGASEFLHLADTSGATMQTEKGAAPTDLRATFAALAPGKVRLGAIELHVREQLATVLKTAPERIDAQKPMGSMGVDSLLALEFVRRLSRTLDLKVPATVVFNYPTVKKLAALLESRLGFDENTTPAVAPASTPTAAPAPESDVDDMSDLDAIRALSGNG